MTKSGDPTGGPGSVELYEIIEQIRSVGPEVICSVAVRWPSGMEFFYDADRLLHPASTVKVALMVSVMRLVESGSLATNQTMLVHNEFSSFVPGSRFSVDPGSDSDPGIYSYLGRRLTVWNLALRMIRLSSNLATNLLFEIVGADRIAADMAAIGVEGVHFKRGMDDTPAFESGCINEASARGLLSLAEAVQFDRAASRRSCYLIRQAMFLVQHPYGLAAAKPEGWGVAHKPGWITGHYHDFGMLYAPEATPTLVAVMTRGLTEDGGRAAVAKLAAASIKANN